MNPLLVHVTHAQTGASEAFAFDRSPVRLGRNQLNDLAISDGVVSQWHGVFRFDETTTTFVDLGSTNGTVLGGQRLGRNVEVPVAPGSVLQIAHLHLRLLRAPVPPEMLTRRRNSFLDDLPESPGTASTRTVMFNMGAPTPKPPEADPQVVQEIERQAQAVYAQYVHALSEVTRYVEYYVEQLAPETRGPTLLALAERLPHFARTREFRRLGAKAGLRPEQVGDVDLEDWLKRLLFGSETAVAARGRIDVHESMKRIGALLETFAQAYVDLRSGHEQFLSDFGLRLAAEPDGLSGARSARSALVYLLDWTSDGQQRVDELNRGFADLALHQVGLLNGVIDGVRSILATIRPEIVAGLPPTQRSPGVRTAADGGFMGGKVRQWWRTYATRHGELEESDRFTREMFGRAFAAAYYTVMGSGRR